MAASHEMVAPDVECISKIVRNFSASEVVETTNKRMIMWCPDLHCAKSLAIRIRRAGYHYEVKQGLKTPNWYVQAFY
jgi:hypothetical protein